MPGTFRSRSALSAEAASKVKSLLEQEGRDDLSLRVAVQPGGCSGLRYQLYFDDRTLDGDIVATFDGVNVVTDRMSAPYLAGADPRHPYASPLYADLHGLLPILIHVGDAEVILDDSTRFAAKARAAGVDVTLEVWDQMPHVWHAFAGLLPESAQAIERIGGWLQARCPRG